MIGRVQTYSPPLMAVGINKEKFMIPLALLFDLI